MKALPRHLFLLGLLVAALAPSRAGAALLLSELKVNPPGTNDAPYEFIEIRGTPAATLTNIYLLAIDGNSGGDPGTVTYALNLSGARLGSAGLLVVAATNAPYLIGSGATVLGDPQLNAPVPGGALGNGAVSFLLVSSPSEIQSGQDLDKGNNGILEGLPSKAVILDAVGWTGGGKNDLVYGEVTLSIPMGKPDAATRFPYDNTPRSAAAWFCGNLAGTNADSLVYDPADVSSNAPPGAVLTPGSLTQAAPLISRFALVSGVIGDATNPTLDFTVSDPAVVSGHLTVTATSSNPAVVPDSRLFITAGSGGARSLRLDPVGVGYATITLWVDDGSVTGRLSFPYAASAMGRPGGWWHLGASDGSTAIAMDADFMVIGDDENQTLRLYHRHQSGLPVREFDMSDFLDLPDAKSGLPREVDVEASTRVGHRLFWMGSLGHGAEGESRTNRTRVFATDLSGTGASSKLTYAGRYDFLKVDLINWDKQNLHGKGANYYGLDASDAPGVPPKAPDGSGFSVEGLAMMPGSTNGAYLAFRAPIVPPTNRTYALIVPILNFTTVAASTGPPGSCVFGPPIELDLYGRGIRSIEGNTNGYFLTAGPVTAGVGAYPRDFRLYTWTGNPSDQPQQLTAGLTGLNPEGIVEVPPTPWTPDTEIELVSDEGGTVFYGDDVQAKELPIPNFKKCRSDRVPIGRPTPPVPVILSAEVHGASLTLRWRSLKGLVYRLQATTALGAGAWDDASGDLTASGPYASQAVPMTAAARFYRVVVP